MKTQKDSETAKTQAASECGATHGDCPNTWKGTCDREAGHDGSHHCSSCNSVF
jgi:hypothetical protein